MKGEYKDRLNELVAKLDSMNDKELRHFVAQMYFSLQGMPVLMEFLIHKGIVNTEELKQYCHQKLKEADKGSA